jgi:hypothetical protein
MFKFAVEQVVVGVVMIIQLVQEEAEAVEEQVVI